MQFTIKEVEHIAQLSRLSLNEKEKEIYAEQFSKILAYIEKLNMVDTSNVQPTFQITGLTNIERRDSLATTTLSNASSGAEMVEQSPEKEERYIKIKFSQ